MLTQQHIQHPKTELFLQFGFVFLSAFACWIPRSEFALLITCIALLAFITWKLQHRLAGIPKIGLVLLLLSAFLAPPMLSNDSYRFLWDGELIVRGMNPHAFKPIALMDQPAFSTAHFRELFNGMGTLSQNNYSCYPFVTEVYSTIPALLSDSIYVQILLLKLLFFLTGWAAWHSFTRLLSQLKLPSTYAILFLFHPLVLIEGLVNVHFELVMVALLVVALDLILRRQLFVAGIFLGLAIQVKLIPLLLLPFFLPVLKWKNSFLLGFVSLMIFGLTSLIFIHPSNIHHVLASLQLYYGNFEFNSSTYRLLLTYGFWKYHFYRIPYYGLFLSRIATVLLLLFAWFRMDWSDWSTFFKRISWGFLAYYLCATTVHPWYLIVPLLFGLLAGYRFFYLWGFLIFLSYAFYSEAFVPYLWAIHLLEYGILIGSVVQTVRLDFKKVLTE